MRFPPLAGVASTIAALGWAAAGAQDLPGAAPSPDTPGMTALPGPVLSPAAAAFKSDLAAELTTGADAAAIDAFYAARDYAAVLDRAGQRPRHGTCFSP